MTASDLQAEIMLALSTGPHVRLWRFNSGSAWGGTIVRRSATHLTLSPYYPVKLGPTGYPDLSGWSVTDGVAVWSGVEVKFGRDRIRPAQQAFIDLVLASGGRAGVARSVEEARRIIGMEVANGT